MDNAIAAMVTIDGGKGFPAVVLPGRWNGWVRPLFTRENAEAVVAWVNEQNAEFGNAQSMFAWVGDQIQEIALMPDVYEEGQPVGTVLDRISPDESGLYAIGTDGWTWELVEESAALLIRTENAGMIMLEFDGSTIELGSMPDDAVPGLDDPSHLLSLDADTARKLAHAILEVVA